MTTMPEPMTLEQVRDFLRAEYDMRVANRSASLHKTADFLRASDSIDAELAKQRNAEPVAWAIFWTIVVSVGVTQCSRNDRYRECLEAAAAHVQVECKQP